MACVFRIIDENPAVFGGEHFDRSARSLYDYTPGQMALMVRHMDYPFRCVDSDGIVYFSGLCSAQCFDPLDFGFQFGCTSIEYKNPVTGKWEEL